jgi:nucleotide-binding universal stress UspA family protein
MKTIVAALDFSDASAPVLASAIALSRAFGAPIHVIHVLEAEPAYTAYGFTPDEFPAAHLFQDEARKRAALKLDETVASLPPGLPEASSRLVDGPPLHGILDYVEECGADFLILGSHGHNVLSSLLLGSVAEGIVRKAVVPTLVIPVKKS